MAEANPNNFDYFRRGEPYEGGEGKAAAGTFDYFRRGEPLHPIAIPASDVVDSGQNTMTGTPANVKQAPGDWSAAKFH